MIDITTFMSEHAKQRMADAVVDFVAGRLQGVLSEDIVSHIKMFRSDADFRVKLSKAINRGLMRLAKESHEDSDLIANLARKERIFEKKALQDALISIIKNPGLNLFEEQEAIEEQFKDIFGGRKNQEHINAVLHRFLVYVAEETWSIEEFQGIHTLMFQRLTAEATQKQVALQMAQLEASQNIHGLLSQLSDHLSGHKLIIDTSNATLSPELRAPSISIEQNNKKDEVGPNIKSERSMSRYFELYKNNIITEINNNLVLELYDKPEYEDLCIAALVHFKDTSDPDTQKTMHVLELSSLPRSVILGEPGSGKTTALRQLALELLWKNPTVTVPIYISLASFSLDYSQGKILDFAKYIDEEVSLYGCPSLQQLIDSASSEILLLLDGWDEILKEEVKENIKRYLAITPYHFIITSRPEAQRTLPFADRYEMHPLSIERMREFISRRISNPSDVKKMMKWLIHDSRMMKLAENPLNLSIMTIVYMEEGDIRNLTKTKLYERAFETIIRQHHHAHPYAGLLSSEGNQMLQLDMILQNVAYEAVSSGGGRFFSVRELERSIQKVLGSVPSELSTLLVGRLGIIRDRRSSKMEFFHLWYQEFLVARYIIESGKKMLDELANEKMAGSLLYVVGLMPSTTEAFQLLMNVHIHDPFNYCRAIPECKFSKPQITDLLNRIITYGDTHIPKIPVRVELGRALALGGVLIVPSLFDIVTDENKSDYARRTCLEALALIPLQPGEFEQLLLRLLSTDSLGLLWHVIEHIGHRNITEAEVQLDRYTLHNDPIVCGDSIWALAELRGIQPVLSEEQTERLIACLSYADKHVQGHALRTLGRLRIASAVPKLKQHLAHKDSGYRWIVPEAVVFIGGPDALELLDQALDDDDPRVIAASLKALGDITENVSSTTIDKIQQHINNQTWIAFLEQSLGSLAWATYHKLKDKRRE